MGKYIDYIQPTKYIVSSTSYSDEFDTPVLTPGQTFVLGYTNEEDGIFKASKEEPIILFDDFTTSNHWVDFDFKVKSSASKILVKKENAEVNFRYLFYCIKNIKFDKGEHGRKWISIFSKIRILIPPIEVQNDIVNKLDIMDKLLNDISEGLPAEIEMRQKQYVYYRNKLLNFKNKNY
ncbi:MAG: restriction endonuclease subunit S [Bacilli bacterium]